MPVPFALLADITLIIHTLFIAFVLLGAIVVILGGFKKWMWVRNPLFRWAHLVGILFVTAQSWLGMTCPLTTLEMKLRLMAGDSLYTGGFIQHWLQELIYFAAPTWVFTAAYSLFGLLVALSWLAFPPRRFGEWLTAKKQC
jgi:Protein of Unknown function (DUF2784)